MFFKATFLQNSEKISHKNMRYAMENEWQYHEAHRPNILMISTVCFPDRGGISIKLAIPWRNAGKLYNRTRQPKSPSESSSIKAPPSNFRRERLLEVWEGARLGCGGGAGKIESGGIKSRFSETKEVRNRLRLWIFSTLFDRFGRKLWAPIQIPSEHNVYRRM